MGFKTNFFLWLPRIYYSNDFRMKLLFHFNYFFIHPLRRYHIQLRIGVCYPTNFRQLSLFIGTNFWRRNGTISWILLVDVICWHFKYPLWINVASFADRLEEQCKYQIFGWHSTENFEFYFLKLFLEFPQIQQRNSFKWLSTV